MISLLSKSARRNFGLDEDTAPNPEDTNIKPAMLMRMRTTVALAVALAGATAFTPPPLFGPPRTRAAALAYAKKAVYKKADKDQQPETTQVHHQVQPHKGPRHSRWSGRVEMSIDPSCVPGTPILRNQKILHSPDGTPAQVLSLLPTISCQSRPRRATRFQS